MRTLLFPIMYLQLILINKVFSSELDELMNILNNKQNERKELNFLEEPLLYNENDDKNLSFEQMVLSKG